MPEHSCAFDSELDQYSMNIEAKEIYAVLSIVQEISPQKSYILISTKFFFECEKKNEPPFVVLYLQSYVLFCSVCGHHGCELKEPSASLHL